MSTLQSYIVFYNTKREERENFFGYVFFWRWIRPFFFIPLYTFIMYHQTSRENSYFGNKSDGKKYIGKEEKQFSLTAQYKVSLNKNATRSNFFKKLQIYS